MPRFLVFVILVMAAPLRPAAGQETLYGVDRTHGGFGGVAVRRSTLNGEAAWLVGFRAGWVYNARPRHTLVLGVGAYGVTTDVAVEAPGSGVLGFDYGGLELEYVYRTRARVHPSVRVFVGAGNAAVGGDDRRSDDLFVAEPCAVVWFNVTEFMRAGVGAGYRLVRGVDLEGIEADDLTGATGIVSVILGRF